MEVQDDDLMVITFRVNYPEWLDELSVEEFSNVLKKARHNALKAIIKEFDKAEEHWKERKKQSLEGQMDIFDV